MPERSGFGDRSRLPFLQQLGVVAATILAAPGGPVPGALAAGLSPSPDLSHALPTRQACIEGSLTGTTIEMQAGIYYTDALTLNKAVSLTGVSSAIGILNGLAIRRLLTVIGAALDSPVIISGLTFSGSHAVGGNCPNGCGGAILVTATAQSLLINLTITNSCSYWSSVDCAYQCGDKRGRVLEQPVLCGGLVKQS